MYYAENKLKARTSNKGIPTRTDQSQAKDTDLNVILGKFAISGRVTGTSQGAMYGDFTRIPRDLREMIDTARDLENQRKRLPKALRDMPVEELMALTPDKLKAILEPAPEPKEEPKEAPKEKS